MGVDANIYAGILKSGQGLAGIFGASQEAEADVRFGQFQRQQYDTNKELAYMAAEDATRRGAQVAGRVRREGKAVQGGQRAALAAQGIDVSSGSAADLQAETRYINEQDILTVNNNVWREAWGLKVQGTQYGLQGALAEAAGYNKARNTLLTGGIKSIGYGLEAYDNFYPSGTKRVPRSGSEKGNYFTMSPGGLKTREGAY